PHTSQLPRVLMSFVTGGHLVYVQEPTDTPWALKGQIIFLETPLVLPGFLGDNIFGFLSSGNAVAGAMAVDAGVQGVFSDDPILGPLSATNPIAGILKTVTKLLGRMSAEVTVSGTLLMSTGGSIGGELASESGLAGTIGIGENSVAGDFSKDQGIEGSMSRIQSVVGEIT
ncbi:MAG: hypothetical protein ACTSYX_04585, partial [Candidatus Thorarchaeota archaeon]